MISRLPFAETSRAGRGCVVRCDIDPDRIFHGILRLQNVLLVRVADELDDSGSVLNFHRGNQDCGRGRSDGCRRCGRNIICPTTPRPQPGATRESLGNDF